MTVAITAPDGDDRELRIDAGEESTRCRRSATVVCHLEDLSAKLTRAFTAQPILHLARRVTREKHPECSELRLEGVLWCGFRLMTLTRL